MKKNKRLIDVLPLWRVSFLPYIYKRIGGVYISSAQLQSLINEWVDLRKQEMEHMKLRVNHYDMVTFLKEHFLALEKYAQENGIQLQFVTSEEAIDVWFDNQQMQKVVDNLFSHAVQYAPRGGMVTLTINKDVDKVGISVKGLPKCLRGKSLGLALAKEIVELHGGTIGVENIEEGRVAFTFCLPLGYAHFRLEEIKQGMEILEREGNKSMFKILIVEDDEELRTILVDIFTPFYIVEQASDAKEALDKIDVSQPDIILSDAHMSLVSGIELCRRVKTDIATSYIPVVLFSVSDSTDYELEGLKFGADAYIVKPFNVNVLLAKCQNLIKLRIANQKQFMKGPTTQMEALSPLDKEFMDRAMGIIETNVANSEFNISMFVKEMGVGRTILFNKLRTIVGQSPNDYIITVRLKKAISLLENNPDLNITEISEMTGFNYVGYFGRVFKERYKMTPSDYRNMKKTKEK